MRSEVELEDRDRRGADRAKHRERCELAHFRELEDGADVRDVLVRERLASVLVEELAAFIEREEKRGRVGEGEEARKRCKRTARGGIGRLRDEKERG